MKRLRLFKLGGTIAMTEREGGALPLSGGSVSTEGFVRDGWHIDSVELGNRPSNHLDLAHLYELAGCIASGYGTEFDAVIVVSGTDTLEELAFGLSLVISEKVPLVVTGAMRVPSAPGADGPANLHHALELVSDSGAEGRGPLVVMNATAIAARHVVKSHTARPDAFSCRDGSPQAILVEGKVQWQSPRLNRVSKLEIPGRHTSKVALYRSFMGDDGVLLAGDRRPELDGIVVEALGGGSLYPTLADRLAEYAHTIPVMLASRCAAGPVLTRTYASQACEIDLINRGLCPVGSISGTQARLALSVLLDSNASRSEIFHWFHERPPITLTETQQS